MKILFLSRWFPYPANNGSKLRIIHLLKGLADYHDVTLLSFADQSGVDPDAPQIREFCSDVHIVPWKEFDPRSWKARLGFLNLKPRSIVDTFSSEMAQKITQLTGRKNYDLIVASQLSMASYRPYFKNIPAIFEEAEIGLSYGETHLHSDWKARLRRTFTWFKFQRYISQLIHSFQACTVVSEHERRLMEEHFPNHKTTVIEVIPNCVQVDHYEELTFTPSPNRIIFSGSFRFQANYEAMLWFTNKVFALILEQIPDVQLVITGDHANLPLPTVANITLAGYVDNIKALIASSNVSIAPLLSGGGTRLKILEAMAIGTPVVSTSKGAEGLDAIPGEHLLVADSPEGFAEQVIKLLKNKNLRNHLSVNGNRFVKENYDWGVVMPRFLSLVEGII